jgi:predicted nucleotidyltransferase
MTDRETIETLSQRIVEVFAPQRIILFGSHATGQAHAGSDVDLLVVLPYEGSPVSMSVEILRALQPRVPVDVIVRTPEEMERRLALGDFFLREIMARGVVLYESADARVA